jgi:ornithine carbamoyltransferase
MSDKLNMTGRSLLTLLDLSKDEFLGLLDLADDLKRKKASGERGTLLDGRHIALVFEKSSTRTRCSASVAMADEGGRAEYLSSNDSHLGKKESPKDTARVLGRLFDGIFFRGYSQQAIDLLSQYSGVPVWNALTDQCHPTQTLADLMTVREKFGKLAGLKLVYVGDGRNNVVNSLMLGCAMTGVNFVNCTPKELEPESELIRKAAELADANGSTVEVINDPAVAVQGANVVCTDVWVSMGEESQKEERLRLLQPYQVNMDLMQKTGNVENGEVIFLHCLPAFHDNNTAMTKDCGAMEVTDDVFESEFSKVFDEAENRMHTIKAMLVATLVNA